MEDGNEQHARVVERSIQELSSCNDLVQRFALFSQSTQCRARIGPGGSLFCSCEGCLKWRAFVEGQSPDCNDVQYEVFTLEHVKGLADYLLRRAREFKLPEMNVLEVGAGSGRLCYHLNRFLSEPSFPSSQGCVVHLTATDSGERGLNGPNVAKKDAIEAISEAMSHVVLASWMPLGVDWTAHMRATPSVLEYILIGEIDNGICGDPWLTWGYTEEEDSFSDSSSEDPTFLDGSDGLLETNSFSDYEPGRPIDVGAMDSSVDLAQYCSEQKNPPDPDTGVGFGSRDEELLVGNAQNPKRPRLDAKYLEKFSKCEDPRTGDTVENTGLEIISNRANRSGSEMPPYAADGWARIELASLSAFQVCRTDERWFSAHHSHTVVFRRCTPRTFKRYQ